MFIYTLKASSIKFFAVVMLSVVALVVFVTMVPQYAEGETNVAAIQNSKLETNDERVTFLRNQGLNVIEAPCEIVEVVLPNEFDSVFNEYNSLQRSQGLDLEKFKGKTVTRYTYVVDGYDYDGKVLANIIIYKDKMIAGDVCSVEGEGFISKILK